MAAAGTGLPLADRNGATLQPAGTPQQVRFDDGGASSWTQIAAMGARLTSEAADTMRLETHQAQVGYLADQDVEIARKRIELRDQFANDPDGFDAAWKGYSDGKLGQAEPWAVPHVQKLLGSEGNAAYSAILAEKRAQDQRLDSDRVSALATLASNDVIGSAMAGTFNTPEGQAKLEKFRAVMATAVTSKLIAPEEAERRATDLANRATAETLIKDIRDKYTADRANGETAGPAALQAAEQRILRDPGLPLSEEQRYAYFAKASAEIRALEAERKQDLALARQGMSDAMYAMSRGVRVDPSALDDIATQLSAAGGQADVAKLRAAAARADQMAAFGRLPLAEQAQTLDRQVNPPPADLKEAVKRFEGFMPRAQWDFRQYTNGFGTRAEKQDEVIDQATADKRLDAELGKAAAVVDQVNPNLPPGVKKALTSLTFNAGADWTKSGLGDSIRRGDFETAKRQFLQYNQAGGRTNPALLARRKAEAQWFDNGGPGAAQAAGPYDFRLVAGEQSALDKSADTEWERVSKDLEAGVRPAPGVLHSIIQAYTLTGNHDKLETVAAAVDRFDARVAAGRAPPAEVEASITQLQQVGAGGGLSPGQSAWLTDLQKVNAATEKQLREDPVGLAAERFPERFNTPAPLNIADSRSLRAGLAQRGQMAEFVAQNYQVPAVSALTPADQQAIKAALAAADPAGKARIYGDIAASLPEPVRNATLAQLGKEGGGAATEAFAGALYQEAPAVAESILRGQKAIAADKRFDPTSEGMRKDFEGALDKAMPVTTFGLSLRTGDSGAYATMRSAIRARYADLAAQNGDTSAALDEDRLQRAVVDVTGGVLRHNGGTLIAPRRGLTQDQFDQMLGNMKDDDLFGVTTLSGTPITADYLRGNARMESIGDGRYLLQLGADPERPIYAFMNVHDPFGVPQPYVLDLRDRPVGPPVRVPLGARGVEFAPYPRG